jgi:hypothetical protein
MLNEYMSNRVSRVAEEDRCDDLLSNAEEASELGVDSDESYNTLFNLSVVLPDLLKDTFDLTLPPEQLKSLKQHLLGKRKAIENLVDLRSFTYSWLTKHPIEKQAHPNTGGFYTQPANIDVGKWVDTAKNMYIDIHMGMGRNAALDKYVDGWDFDEATRFDHWLKYYESNNSEKYNVKTANIIKVAFGESTPVLPKEWENPAARSNQSPFMAQDNRTKKELEQDKAKALKSKMKSRIRSLKMLLDKYNDLLPHQDLDKLHDEVVLLEKSVGKLNAYASLQDRIIRSASIMEHYGFEDGARLLKTADGDLGPGALDSNLTDQTNLPVGQLKADVDLVINRLEGISKVLKMRDLVRELSKTDIMLSDLGLASYFPEITDAISKLIEGFGYSSNRIEGVIAKLRGTGKKTKEVTTAPAPLPTPTSPGVAPKSEQLEMGELMNKPVAPAAVPAAPKPAPVAPKPAPLPPPPAKVQ